MTAARARAIALWLAFAGVLFLKFVFVDTRGTGDMDTALSWGHALLRNGLVDGYTGSNFPIAFQLYEGLVWFADKVGMNEYTAMKSLDLVCDVGTFFALRALLRGWALSPDWAFLYWLSPYYLVMYWLGYDHFQMGLIVVVCLLAIQRARSDAGWLLASAVLGVAFLQRPQVQVLVAVLGLYVAVVAVERRRDGARRALWNERTRPALLLLVGPAVLFAAYSLWFWIGGRYALYLAREYAGLGVYSPSLSANMLNVWAMVAEGYRSGGEKLYMVERPEIFHTIAAVIGGVALVGGVWLIARRAERRPFSLTVLYLFAYGAILLPNVYTRAHENHFFLGGLLAVPLVALLPRRALALSALLATLALQGFNAFGIYGFGYTPLTSKAPYIDIENWWSYSVRFVAAGVAVALFVALMTGLRPLLGAAGDRQPREPAPATPRARRWSAAGR
jgi:hypothetical protein